jgi:selenocysteine lyase/cysteine desulfurase
MTLSRRAFLGATSMIPLASRVRDRAAPVADPLGVRRDFPVTHGPGVYLNSAYITPVPTSVADAARDFAGAKTTRPISLGDMQARADQVRRQFANLINASEDEVGFLAATSEGENLVAHALDLRAGDNVVVDALHYETEFVLYKRLEQTRGIELRIANARDGAVATADFESLVDRRTRLISVALVSHQNGFKHDLKPLADLAHAHGAWLYTDAIQAAGMIPINVSASEVDALCAGTYKWLLGGFGTAPFFVRRELLERFVPDRWGALHVAKDLGNHQYEIYSNAKKFEYATLAFGAVNQLGAGLAYLDRVGVSRIEAHTVALAHQLWDGLVERGFHVLTPAGNGSSIVSFKNPVDPVRMRQTLQAAGIDVSYRENGTQVRVSPALFNVREDIDSFLKAMDPLLR